MNAKDAGLATIVVTVWGINFVAAKLGTRELPPLLFTAIRFAFVALAVIPFFPRPRGQLRLIGLLSLVLGVGHFGILYVGIKGLDAATAAIALQLCMPFSALVAAVAYGERLGPRGLSGMVLALAGVVLLAGEPHRPDLLSLGLVVFAALAWALSNLVVKRLGPIRPLLLNGWTCLFAVPPLLLLSALVEHGQIDALRNAGWTAWGAMAFTVVAASLVAYTLWYRLIARQPINRVVPFTLLNPVIGVASGVLALGEPLSWQKLVGGALTLAGVAVIQLRAPAEDRR